MTLRKRSTLEILKLKLIGGINLLLGTHSWEPTRGIDGT